MITAESVAVQGGKEVEAENIAIKGVDFRASSVSRGQGAANAVSGVVSGYPEEPSQEWASDQEREGAWWEVQWMEPVEITQIQIFDRINPLDHVEKAKAVFDDGRYVVLEHPAGDGSAPAVAVFPPTKTKSLRIDIIETGPNTRNVGLAEVIVLNAPSDSPASQIYLPSEDMSSSFVVPEDAVPDPAIRPDKLQINGQENPTHVVDVAPRFSWQIPDGRKQNAFRIRLDSRPEALQSDDVFLDTGWMEGNVTDWEYWPPDDERRLTEIYKPYYWSVQVVDEEGRLSEWSPVAKFSLGVGLPPRWYFGIGWSRYHYENTDQVREVMRVTRENKIPGDWIHPDFAWGGHWDTLTWNEEGWTDAPELIEQMDEDGYRLMLIDHHGISPTNDPERAAYMEERGWLDKTQPGIGDRIALNFRNPEAREYFQKNYLKPLYQDGIGGWKLDGTCGWGTLWRNRDYRLWDLYHKTFFDAQAEYTEGGDGRGVITARTMSKVYPGLWTDDIPGDWPTFASQIQVLNRLSEEGFNYVMADAGGFNSRMTPEGFVRWSQQALLSPLIWTHDGNEPWRFYGEDAMNLFRDFARLRYRLMPYLYTLASRNYQDGSPITRSMRMEFPEEKIPGEMQRDMGHLGLGFFHHYASDHVKGDWRVRLIETQYLLGRDLLVVPVIEPGDWQHPDFRNDTAGEGRYLATYVEPEREAFDEALQTVEVAEELVYRVRPLEIPNPVISIGLCALPRWQRGASGMPPMDVVVESEKVKTVEPLHDPGMHQPLVVSFAAEDKTGDGWVEIRMKAAEKLPEAREVTAEEWEQQLAGRAWLRNVFANVLWQYDADAVSEDDLLTGASDVPFRMNLGVFHQKIAHLQAKRTFWLPPGKWAEWFSGEIFDGPRVVEQMVPMDRLVFLMREGAIVPLQPEMNYIDEIPVDPMTWVIFPSTKETTFSLYEDDGKTRDYTRGIHAETTVSAVKEKDGLIRISLFPPKGPFANQLPENRRHQFEVIGPQPSKVTAQDSAGRALDLKWHYEEARGRTLIDLGSVEGQVELTLL